MLAVTDVAADAINDLTSNTDDREQHSGGLRFSVDSEDTDNPTLNASVAAQPAPGDQVVTADSGAQVFLEPEAAKLLNDKVLDVQEVDGQPSFAIRDQG
jgi:iron-sulfur cluster assembly protein